MIAELGRHWQHRAAVRAALVVAAIAVGALVYAIENHSAASVPTTECATSTDMGDR